MTLDVDRLRADTPGCETLLHLDNAGAALQPRCVREAVAAHLELEQDLGGYAAEGAVAPNLAGLYDSLAGLIGAQPSEIAVMENATRAWDAVFYALAQSFKPRDVILTSRAEYASNVLAFLQVARRTGAEVEFIGERPEGGVDVADLERRLTRRVRLVAISHVPSQRGLVQPAAEIGRLTRSAGVFYLLDACQSVGQLPIDAQEIGCDALTATSRKFLRGPRGVGFLYLRSDSASSLEPPAIDLRGATWTATEEYALRTDAKRFETWESDVAARLGFKAAVDYARGIGVERLAARIAHLSAHLRSNLKTTKGVRVLDDGDCACGITSMAFTRAEARVVHAALTQARVNTTVISTATARADFEALGVSAVLRASLHAYNTEAELDRFCTELERVMQ